MAKQIRATSLVEGIGDLVAEARSVWQKMGLHTEPERITAIGLFLS